MHPEVQETGGYTWEEARIWQHVIGRSIVWGLIEVLHLASEQRSLPLD